ncbi:MAG: hypothetical protein KBC84_03330, partial [Proteobacteria bacterium]|nr:hypothetical protein [Pseudomonadota bacterium]
LSSCYLKTSTVENSHQESIVYPEETKAAEHSDDIYKAKAFTKTTKPLNAFELGRYQYCGVDKDCIVVNNGCCDCANGGVDVAINRERQAAFNERFNCMGVSCGRKTIDPICGSGLISCVNHKCVFYPPKKSEDRF